MEQREPYQPHDWKDYRRLRAWELAQAGWKQCAIARARGVTPGAVSQWLKRARTAGQAALRQRPPPGRPPRLTAAQRAQLPALVARGAEAFGLRGAVWTTRRVAAMIARTGGVQYQPAPVSRLLRALGWSPHQPRVQATQRDAAASAAWWRARWPALKNKPVGKAARSSG